jgi:hypothetical protein
MPGFPVWPCTARYYNHLLGVIGIIELGARRRLDLRVVCLPSSLFGRGWSGRSVQQMGYRKVRDRWLKRRSRYPSGQLTDTSRLS